MTQLVVRGGQVLTPLEERLTDILIEDGRIVRIGDLGYVSGAQIIDAAGRYVTPGLFDLQVNGGPECDFWGELEADEVSRFTRSLARAGVTAFLPTIITGDLQEMRKNVQFLKKAAAAVSIGNGANGGESSGTDRSSTGAQYQYWSRMPGVHLEGPCLSPAKPGVHPPQHLQPLDAGVLEKLLDDNVKLITLAPELDPSGECLQMLHDRGVKVALGHSNATYGEAQSAFAAGVQMMTHTFNALPGLHHRNPGAVMAALLDDEVYCCMICDGKHLDPAAAQLIFKTKGLTRTILVTDIAHIGTNEGGLVGSSIMLDEAVRNVVEWGICSFRDAIVMAAYNPARAMGMDGSIGQLEVGRDADLVLWNQRTLAVEKVCVGGVFLSS